MAKYHINKHGVPAICKAKDGNCPLGGEGEHFDTFKEAQEQADKTNKKEYGVLSVIIGGKDDKSEPSSEKVSPFGVDDSFKTQEEAYEYIDKQYEKGYESPLNKKKTSPLGDKGNFKSREEAQRAADKKIEDKYGSLDDED